MSISLEILEIFKSGIYSYATPTRHTHNLIILNTYDYYVISKAVFVLYPS